MVDILLGLLSGFLDNTLFLMAHVTNSNTFPEPLSEEEEKIYIKRNKEGDLEAKNMLITHNLRLVSFIAGKYNSSGRELEDLISIGSIGLIKAVRTFNDTKGIKLSSYASRCIENEILMNKRLVRKNSKEVSIYSTLGIDKDGNEICLIDILKTKDDSVFDEVDSMIELKKLRSKISSLLNDKDRKIIQMRYGLKDDERKTQQEIADMYGISRSYVSRIEKRILEILREALSSENYKRT